MGRDKDAYCKFPQLFGHATEKWYKLKDWLAAKFMVGEIEGIEFDLDAEMKKKKNQKTGPLR